MAKATPPPDDALDDLEAQLHTLKGRVPTGAAAPGAPGGAAPGFDPATLLALIDAVLKLVDLFRQLRGTP